MSPYHYPDFKDVLILKFLEKFEKDDPYWEESERAILDRIFDYIGRKEGFRYERCLDAGCGRGRLLWVFRKLFRVITAIEPDGDRFAEAVEMAEAFGMSEKTTMQQVSAEEFASDDRFDLIFCSHVIQHIHTDHVLPLMKNLAHHLSDNGVIALTTCHSTGDVDQYGNNYLQNGTPVRETVSREEFNNLVNSSGVLPVHYFHAEQMMSDFADIGLKTVDFRVFHVAREERDVLRQPDIDNYVNASPDLQQRYGVDMFLLLEKG